MLYKVGDKVRVKFNLEAGKHYERGGHNPPLFCNQCMAQFAGAICTIKSAYARGAYTLEEDTQNFLFAAGMFEEDLNMTLNDLKDGMVVKTREGMLGMVHGARILFEKSHTDLNEYKMDLTRDDEYNRLDIIAIYRSDRPTSLNTFFRVDNLIELWERAPEVEMTVAQIEEKLGYRIKIISEE